MKSKFADYFNHDEDARVYDEDVMDESRPVRKGYSAVLSWIGRQVRPSDSVLDLGCGTGNTVLALSKVKEIICVDISANMLRIAEKKCAHLKNISFIQSDLLEFFDKYRPAIDTVTSTYAIHHLTDDEKYELFKRVKNILKTGGQVLVGDLMFKNKRAVNKLKKKLAAAYPEFIKDIEEEFYWNIDISGSLLRELGFKIRTTRFSELSWGIRAEIKKRPPF